MQPRKVIRRPDTREQQAENGLGWTIQGRIGAVVLIKHYKTLPKHTEKREQFVQYLFAAGNDK